VFVALSVLCISPGKQTSTWAAIIPMPYMSAAILTIATRPARIETKRLSKLFDQNSEEGYEDGSVQKTI
jgi:hypothetical protein